VKDFPSIIVYKSWDQSSNQTLDSAELIKYSKKEYKLDELKEFLTPLAKSQKKDPPVSTTKKSSEEDEEGPSKA
jgi:hypothetical protein